MSSNKYKIKVENVCKKCKNKLVCDLCNCFYKRWFQEARDKGYKCFEMAPL